MPTIIPNYHPIFVHFTIALMVTSFGMLLLHYLFKTKPQLRQECLIVSRWCLWLAALVSILTVIAGLHAYYTVAHDAITHKVMTTHRNWGIATFVAIWVAAINSFVLYLKQKPPHWLFTGVLAIAVVLVMVTGWYGAELVFRYGTGVMSLPQSEGAGHQHDSANNMVAHEDSDNHQH